MVAYIPMTRLLKEAIYRPRQLLEFLQDAAARAVILQLEEEPDLATARRSPKAAATTLRRTNETVCYDDVIRSLLKLPRVGATTRGKPGKGDGLIRGSYFPPTTRNCQRERLDIF